MAEFNYQKAYFTQAKPAFEGLNDKQRGAFDVVAALVADLSQDKQLLIPAPDQAIQALKDLTSQELAELSRTSYFIGHWKPGHTAPLFDNSKGQSWKVSNCCDQVLRLRLNPHPRIEIHEGKLRFTFSSRDCWMWNEFGLATEENLAIFNELKGSLPAGEENFERACEVLKEACSGLWPPVEDVADNAEYMEYLADVKARLIQQQHDKYNDELIKLDRGRENALKELNFRLVCIEHDLDISNLIYYDHKDTFCFGWRAPIDTKTASKIKDALSGYGFTYEIKESRHA